ncbi:GTPase IMAP family member 7-like isoform X1 [Synchiropus splendidus]|uniref:GTPase IMAP family member 7-like isoform X1 n=1 Tax=Synchiropus splendidus TaxID=270530 RepID=UPI00237D5A8E|nr:GTPase IMAP family member 7-like isoform X1 [Synchiropus splendidus]
MDLERGREEVAWWLGVTVEQLRTMQLDERHRSCVTSDGAMRIVLVGKTGNGKSSTGNVILGGNHFETKFSAQSLTINCSKAEAIVDGQKVAVIDTPGLFDTRSDSGQTSIDISRCVSLSSPGSLPGHSAASEDPQNCGKEWRKPLY